MGACQVAPLVFATPDVRTAGPVWHASSMYLHRVPWVRGSAVSAAAHKPSPSHRRFYGLYLGKF